MLPISSPTDPGWDSGRRLPPLDIGARRRSGGYQSRSPGARLRSAPGQRERLSEPIKCGVLYSCTGISTGSIPLKIWCFVRPKTRSASCANYCHLLKSRALAARGRPWRPGHCVEPPRCGSGTLDAHADKFFEATPRACRGNGNMGRCRSLHSYIEGENFCLLQARREWKHSYAWRRVYERGSITLKKLYEVWTTLEDCH